MLLDIGATDARVLSLGGTVTVLNDPQRLMLPALTEVMLPRKKTVAELEAQALGKRSIVETLSVPAFAEELSRAQRASERLALHKLNALLGKEREMRVQTKRAQLLDATLDPLMVTLTASLPRVLELGLAHAAQADHQVSASGADN